MSVDDTAPAWAPARSAGRSTASFGGSAASFGRTVALRSCDAAANCTSSLEVAESVGRREVCDEPVDAAAGTSDGI